MKSQRQENVFVVNHAFIALIQWINERQSILSLKRTSPQFCVESRLLEMNWLTRDRMPATIIANAISRAKVLRDVV